MAKEKYLITSDCRIDGKHTAKGTVLNLDPTDAKEGERIALLHRAGRIAVWTPKNEKFIQDEIKRETDEKDRLHAERTKALNSGNDVIRRLVQVLQPAAS